MFLRNYNLLFKCIKLHKHSFNKHDVYLDFTRKMCNRTNDILTKHEISLNNQFKIKNTEERNNCFNYPELVCQNSQLEDELKGLNCEHGKYGVFDIDDLVDLLRKENVRDIFVSSVPSQIKYVDYIIVVTGKSRRHMLAIAEFVRKVYKRKRFKNEWLPKIEGKNSKDWLALDLGNIALHIFSKDARKLYDIDLLWAVGHEYDPECNKPEDPFSELLEKHSHYLQDLQPAELNNTKTIS